MWHYWACGIIHSSKYTLILVEPFIQFRLPVRWNLIFADHLKKWVHDLSHIVLHYISLPTTPFEIFKYFWKQLFLFDQVETISNAVEKRSKRFVLLYSKFTNEIKTFVIILNEAGQLIQTLLSKRSYRTLDDKVTQHDGSRITHICSQ